jgi:hypothetical protein
MDVNRGISVTTTIWYRRRSVPIRIEHGPSHPSSANPSKDQLPPINLACANTVKPPTRTYMMGC